MTKPLILCTYSMAAAIGTCTSTSRQDQISNSSGFDEKMLGGRG